MSIAANWVATPAAWNGKMIADSVKLKAEVVTADERENGLRRILNFGHTIGHALEAESGYRHLLHGEAVAWGMIAAAHIATALDGTTSPVPPRITQAVRALGSCPKFSVAAGHSPAAQSDKKTRHGVVHFVLPREIGKVEIASDVPEQVVIAAVDDLRRLSR